MAEFDVVVIGLGAIGSAALYHLARRGHRVLGVERFTPGHDRGSSHGETRIIRLSYFEHPSYVPLLRASYALCRELEANSGQRLLSVSGIVEIGAPDSALVRGTAEASRQHALPHEVLDSAELMRRFPAFQVPPHFIGIYQPDGGFLAAEPTVAAHLALARAAGAQIQTNTQVIAVEPRNGGVRVVTESGAIDAAAAVVAAGPWLSTLVPRLRPLLRVTRQVLGWFAPRQPALFGADRFPVFLLESRHGIHYGVPLHADSGVKIAKHHHLDETVDPESYDRQVSATDEAALRNAIGEFLPAANGPLRASKTCLYTMTPDGDFIIDRVPGFSQVVVGSVCSGHGFKFAPVAGEILADLATKRATPHEIAQFRLSRFA